MTSPFAAAKGTEEHASKAPAIGHLNRIGGSKAPTLCGNGRIEICHAA